MERSLANGLIVMVANCRLICNPTRVNTGAYGPLLILNDLRLFRRQKTRIQGDINENLANIGDKKQQATTFH